MEEFEAIQAARQDDLEAFNQLLLKYQDIVFGQAYLILQNYDIAEDIAQEAFILAFQRLYQYRGGSFRAWLLKIVTNLCYSEMRTWKRASLQSLEPLNQDGELFETPDWIKDTNLLPEESVELHELHVAIEHGLSGLQINYRNAVTLVDIQQLNYKEAAFVIGISIGTLKSRLARGRMQLRKNLKNLDTPYVPEPNMSNLVQSSGEHCVNYI